MQLMGFGLETAPTGIGAFMTLIAHGAGGGPAAKAAGIPPAVSSAANELDASRPNLRRWPEIRSDIKSLPPIRTAALGSARPAGSAGKNSLWPARDLSNNLDRCRGVFLLEVAKMARMLRSIVRESALSRADRPPRPSMVRRRSRRATRTGRSGSPRTAAIGNSRASTGNRRRQGRKHRAAGPRSHAG
jgi:hypothetical protein